MLSYGLHEAEAIAIRLLDLDSNNPQILKGFYALFQIKFSLLLTIFHLNVIIHRINLKNMIFFD